MAGKKKTTEGTNAAASTKGSNQETSQRPRLRKLTIKNFGCIGSHPVSVDLNDIVVLVGPNNSGKSTILRAYEVAMSEGSKEAKLTIDDFPNRQVDSENLPVIELETVVFDNAPGDRWIDASSGESIVRERWEWSSPNQNPKRQGFDINLGDWAQDGVPWGAANVANSRRPQPLRIETFAKPETQADQVTSLLLAALKERLKETPLEVVGEDGNPKKSDYAVLLETFATLQKSVVEDAKAQIKEAEAHLSSFINAIFRGYKVEFDARPEEDIEAALNFFKAGAELRMGPETGFLSPVDRQGSGARRALMWAALRYIRENIGGGATGRPHLLLLDEPELCLHPNAVRDACRLLYDLPSTGNWQVMVTTHAPAFVDLSRDNTTIVRVDRSINGDIRGTTIFRPDKVKLDEDEKTELKLLNLCDPHFTEFFFGGHTVIVEGDTEYAAFNHVRAMFESEFSNVHVVRARGKVTVALLAKIINQFGGNYAVLHDSDLPLAIRRSGKVMKNPAWTNNQKIKDEVLKATGNARHVTALQNFEVAVFGEEAFSEKPYNAKQRISREADALSTVKSLLTALCDYKHPVPKGFVEWTKLTELEELLPAFVTSQADAAEPEESTS